MTYNFNPGPAMLPPEVMQQAQSEFCDYNDLGCGIVEISHRSSDFDAVRERADQNIRELTSLADNTAVLFLQGGASLQFAMVPMNLLPSGATADYVDTGPWSSKAIKEAGLIGHVRVIAGGKEAGYTAIPDSAAWELDDAAAYLHITSNNTIAGTQYSVWPSIPDAVPLICDMSSDIFSRDIDFNRFGLIYAGAQKNLGPSGVTVVLIRRELADRVPDSVPGILRYTTHIEGKSVYNTPSTFGIYMVAMVTDWMKRQGGLSAIERINDQKAKTLYDLIDADDFYRGTADPGSRSKMNVCFRLADEELEKIFLAESAAAGFMGLKGHRSVGGMRASIYNAMPLDGVVSLADFMREFRRRNG